MDEQVAALTEESQSRIQSGMVTIANVSEGPSVTTVPVSFDREYASPPNVVITSATGMNQSKAESFSIQVYYVTKTGFEIWAGCNIALTNVKVYWIAVG